LFYFCDDDFEVFHQPISEIEPLASLVEVQAVSAGTVVNFVSDFPGEIRQRMVFPFVLRYVVSDGIRELEIVLIVLFEAPARCRRVPAAFARLVILGAKPQLCVFRHS
jgi:hypothetical protein